MSAWRGVAGGFSALPWQELNARFPDQSPCPLHWFFTCGRASFYVVGSLISGFVLANFDYQKTMPLASSLPVAVWISWSIYIQNREPELDFFTENRKDEANTNKPEST